MAQAIKAGGLMSPRTAEDAARILTNAESMQCVNDGDWIPPHVYAAGGLSKTHSQGYGHAALAESLAAITADGGPLDQLAEQALDGALYSMERWSVLLDVHRQNMTAQRGL